MRPSGWQSAMARDGSLGAGFPARSQSVAGRVQSRRTARSNATQSSALAVSSTSPIAEPGPDPAALTAKWARSIRMFT
ncbi:hypothetical protein B7P34_01425 [Streptosporangium nondiastaticum]|uniref:Uncharacterized protein n=1 Tax=Streptosporangium nondiastaticum TaxID=35764 RepID=A0A9X7JVN8_9ACTN|nr:hypothetical protein B7P34_01425 [Streptosporangium nondiastaticum]